eukprot:8365372-Pyramimonas_sp.AAC.1
MAMTAESSCAARRTSSLFWPAAAPQCALRRGRWLVRARQLLPARRRIGRASFDLPRTRQPSL